MENIDLANLGELTPQQAITLIYIAYYDRAPDPVGHNFWENSVLGRPRTQEREGAAVDGAILTGQDGFWGLDDIGSQFSDQDETRTNYPFFANLESATREQVDSFIDSVYQNLFGRTADQEGLDFHGGNLFAALNGQNDLKIGEIIVEIAKGAQNTSAGQDLTVVQNKIGVANAWLEAARSDADLDYENNTAAKTSATATVKSVTSEQSSVDTANAAITDFFAPEAPQGVTINLTTSTDQPGGGGNGIDTQGAAGDDSYAATFQAGTGSTLQNTDNIAAGGGTDTLTIRVLSTTGEIVAPVASGLENIIINNQAPAGNAPFALNFDDIAGELEVTAARNNASATTLFSNLDAGTKVNISDNDGGTLAHFKGDRNTSSNDRFDLAIEDSGTSDQSTVFITTDENGNSTDETFEVAAIETGGSEGSFLDARGMTLTSLIVTGSQTLSVEDNTDSFEVLTSADASGMTAGGLNLNAEANTVSSFSFTGSGQADSVELNKSLFNNANTLSLNGGDGTDKIIVENFNNLDASSVNQATSFEELEATDEATSLDASDFTNIHTFIFDGQSTNNNGRLSISNINDNDLFVWTSDQGDGDETVRFSGENAGTSLTFELQASSETNGEIRIISDANTNNSSAIGFGNSNINSVEIISSGSNTNANVIRGVENNDNHFGFDNENGPSSFSISGGQALTITAEVGVNLDSSSDERGFREAVNLNGSDATGNLRIAGSSSADVIQGGSGDDIIYGMGGDNVLTGNGGEDQFRFSDFNNASNITDFDAGDDKIGLERIDFDNTNASSAGAVLDTDDYIENVQSISNLSNAESEKVVELQSALSANQITTSTGGATNAYIVVFNTTTNKGELWFDSDWSDAGNRTQTAEFTTITELADLVGLSNTNFVEYTF